MQLYLKMLGCFNPILGQIWTNSNIKNIVKCIPMAGFVQNWVKQPSIF